MCLKTHQNQGTPPTHEHRRPIHLELVHNNRLLEKSLNIRILEEHTWLTTHVTTQITSAMDTRRAAIATHQVGTVPTVMAVMIVRIVVMTVVSEGAATMVSATTGGVMTVVVLVTVVPMVSVTSVMTVAVATMIVMIVAVMVSAVRIA